MLFEEITKEVVLLSVSDRLSLMQMIIASLQENKAVNLVNALIKKYQNINVPNMANKLLQHYHSN